MIAVILERYDKSLRECFGVESVCDIRIFDTTLKYFLKDNNSLDLFDEIFELPSHKFIEEYNSQIRRLKCRLEKHPSEKVAVTFSDVFVCFDNIKAFNEKISENFLLINEENEPFFCFIKSIDLLGILKNYCDDITVVFEKIKMQKSFKGYVRIINNPLKYKQFCQDVLVGKINYRLPEIAQGIYVPDNIPEGDFVIVPPVYLGEDVQIEKGCVIGPDSIISDGNLIAKNSRVRKSFIGENSYISSGCHIEGSVVSDDVVLRRNSVVLNGSVLCNNVTVGEDSVVENNSFIRAFSRIDDINDMLVNYKTDMADSKEGFYGYSPEKAALLGATVGVCFDMPRIAVGCDGEHNSIALKLALLGGLMTTGATCYDFGNAFFSSMHFFIRFCELECGAFISGNDDGTVISVFRKGEDELSKSDFSNIKSLLSSGFIRRCTKKECKNIRQIHGMQRMYIQYLTSLFTDKIDFTPVFNCDNKRLLSVAELVAAKIGFEIGRERIIFNINPAGTRVSVQSDGIVYPYSKLLEILSFYQRQEGIENSNNLAETDSVYLSFLIIKILVTRKTKIKNLVENLPAFYVVEKSIDNSCRLKILAADLSQDNKIIFNKNEINYNEGVNSVKICENQKGTVTIKARADSMETATEIVEKLTHLITEQGFYNY